jgi:hypothetical protein
VLAKQSEVPVQDKVPVFLSHDAFEDVPAVLTHFPVVVTFLHLLSEEPPPKTPVTARAITIPTAARTRRRIQNQPFWKNHLLF